MRMPLRRPHNLFTIFASEMPMVLYRQAQAGLRCMQCQRRRGYFHPNPSRHGNPTRFGPDLSGENRTYDRRFGRLTPTYISRPNEPFFLGRDEQGTLRFGPGAWELAVRYSYLNLNDGAVQGGILDGVSVGLNWYLNNNLKIQFQYQYSDRLDLAPGVNPGSMNGFGIRTQFFF